MLKTNYHGCSKFLHDIFARCRVLDTIVSDKGTRVTAREFKVFSISLATEHITTPSHITQECFVDTFKKALKSQKSN